MQPQHVPSPKSNFPFALTRWFLSAALGLVPLMQGFAQELKSTEPLNLSLAKASVNQYCDSGDYERDIDRVAIAAQTWIEQRVSQHKPGERLAVVFDIDETLLSNAKVIRNLDYGYVPDAWEAWVSSAEAPAFQSMKALFLKARSLGVSIFLVTGRKDPEQRAVTELNLKRQGLQGYARLICTLRSGISGSTSERKTAERKKIAEEGYVIIANLGDQESDLKGGYSERSFKIPNPLYRAN